MGGTLEGRRKGGVDGVLFMAQPQPPHRGEKPMTLRDNLATRARLLAASAAAQVHGQMLAIFLLICFGSGR